MSETPYLDGKINGVDKVYAGPNKLVQLISYKNGLRNKVSKFYYDSGEFSGEIPYVDGKKDGVAKWYYKSGKLQKEYVYKNNKIIEGITYTENGKKTKLNNAQIHNINLENR